MDKIEIVAEYDRRLGRLREIHQFIVEKALDDLEQARDELAEWFNYWHDGSMVEDGDGA